MHASSSPLISAKAAVSKSSQQSRGVMFNNMRHYKGVSETKDIELRTFASANDGTLLMQKGVTYA